MQKQAVAFEEQLALLAEQEDAEPSGENETEQHNLGKVPKKSQQNRRDASLREIAEALGIKRDDLWPTCARAEVMQVA